MTELYSRAEFVPFTIRGELYDGVTSQSSPAQLLISSRGARLVADHLDIELNPTVLVISDRLGSIPRRIEWQEGSAFITEDNAAADKLRQLLPGGKIGRLAFGLERNLAFAIISLLSVAIVLASVMFWGVPAGARYLATQIPTSLVLRSGNEVMEALDRLHLKPSSLSGERAQELRAYLNKHDSFPPRIEFRTAGPDIGPNAFALPGGLVVITDELIALAASDEHILAVYLHETGHARAQHAETSVLANSAWLVILTILTGDISGMTETVFAVPVMIGNLAFSRELEREADDHAITTLKELGLNPELLADMLEQMTNSVAGQSVDTAPLPNDEPATPTAGSRILDYLSTHPPTGERLNRIRTAAQPDSLN